MAGLFDGIAQLGAEIVPVTWPADQARTHVADRERWKYRAPMASTTSLLAGELRALDATDVAVGLDIDRSSLTKSGMPRAGARVGDPGVTLRLRSHGRTLVYACDGHDLWEHNLRAIALTLEALRAVDRHGATRAGAQYAGYAALPAGGTGTTTREDAARLLILEAYGATSVEPYPVAFGALVTGDQRVKDMLYRAARRHTHPDAGGTAERFDAVRRAYETLGGTS